MNKKLVLGILVMLFMAMTASVGVAAAATIYVPDNYPTIQAAVNAASGGDTVIVRDGIYNESIHIGRRLTIQSENGSANCIVNVSGYYTFIIHSSYVNINGFTIKSAFTGIMIGTNFCNISNNNILLSNHTTYYGYGIKIGGNNNTIIGNTFDGYNMSCYYGIYLDKTNDNIIKYNHISNCTHGIYALYYLYSTNTTIIGNVFEKCGIFIAGGSRSQPYISYIIKDNIVNGKPIYYYKNTEGITVPEDAGQVIVANCSNMTIRNINASSATVGIIIAHCSNMTIRNINASLATEGILLIGTSDSIIENNICNNNEYGIRTSGDRNIIAKNTCNSNKGYGIYIYGGKNNNIENNNCSNNYKGNLACYGHAYYGHGIYVASTYNTITNNLCSNNCGAGIYLSSYGTTISKNTCSNNIWGIYLDDSGYNTIYLNNFVIGNSKYNAYGSTSKNVWNSTTKLTYIYAGETYKNYMGNYWNAGADVDGDGLGDKPYRGFDDYPLMQPFELYFPAENQPPTASFTYSPEKTVVNQTITFDVSASSDDGEIISWEWDFGDGSTGVGKVITHSYSSSGNYTVTLTVTDDRGAKNSTSKLIAVYSTIAVFDTDTPANPYPSIFGTHNGTIKPNQTITVSKLYTYPCSGTGGHSEYIKIWNNSADWNVTARWEGYSGDWHNISFDNFFTLEEGETYNYTIRTGSYPQIRHTDNLSTPTGFITCSEFIDTNGKRYNDWIPAIRLE